MIDRALPQWFDDAKFGIFVHWTAAAVPAFAPVGPSPFELAAEHGQEAAFAQSPYVEWYQNSLAIDGSPGAAAPRRDVRRSARTTSSCAAFLAGHAGWNPRRVGRPVRASRRALRRARHEASRRRPAVAERAPQPAQAGVAVRARHRRRARRRRSAARGMRFGTYYSGGLDWTFGGLPITDFGSMLGGHPAERRVPRRTPTRTGAS